MTMKDRVHLHSVFTLGTFRDEIQQLPENGMAVKLPLHAEIPEKINLGEITNYEYLTWQHK